MQRRRGSPRFARDDRINRIDQKPHDAARLRTDIWVAAYMRTVEVHGGFATLRRRGAAEAGAVFVVLDCLDGRIALYAPGPSDETLGERRFVRAHKADWSESPDISARLSREIQRDPDLWIVDVERRDGVPGLALAD